MCEYMYVCIFIYTRGLDGKVKKWDLKTGDLKATLEGHDGEVMCMVVSEKHDAIFTGGALDGLLNRPL